MLKQHLEGIFWKIILELSLKFIDTEQFQRQASGFEATWFILHVQVGGCRDCYCLCLTLLVCMVYRYVNFRELEKPTCSHCYSQIQAYIEILRFQDRLHAHNYFRKAVVGAIRCYIKLYDSPSKSSTEEDDELEKLPASQKKKLRKKNRGRLKHELRKRQK
ncbi:unnamed protein product [Lactuca saligna]|uniref:Uncharacterized protein n=1 Tax=Lactuca saligna TaxID=75948 RepID=A0AA35VZ38_LACSI|nr:unnamed protein product [Lactuca saligna]